jgi:hypothetical protein
MRAALAIALAAGCGGGGGGRGHNNDLIPLGTYCYAFGQQQETCLDVKTASATKTEVSGTTWFQVTAPVMVQTLDNNGAPENVTLDVKVFGQIPLGAPLPRPADNVFVSFPIAGHCAHARGSLFGACYPETYDTTCEARSVYDGQANVIVYTLDQTSIEAGVNGQLTVILPADCCRNNLSCTQMQPPEQFMPPGPYTVAGRIHVAL